FAGVDATIHPPLLVRLGPVVVQRLGRRDLAGLPVDLHDVRAVDIHRREERQPALAVHDDAEMLVLQLVAIAGRRALVLGGILTLLIAERRERHVDAQELRVVPATGAVVGVRLQRLGACRSVDLRSAGAAILRRAMWGAELSRSIAVEPDRHDEGYGPGHAAVLGCAWDSFEL